MKITGDMPVDKWVVCNTAIVLFGAIWIYIVPSIWGFILALLCGLMIQYEFDKESKDPIDLVVIMDVFLEKISSYYKPVRS